MRPITLLALAAVTLTAGPALAQTYTLDKIQINGLKSASPDEMRAALKEKVGTKVTTDDLVADVTVLEKALEAKNVVGSVKVSMANKHNGHIDSIFDVTDNGIQTATITTVSPKLNDQVFTGNNVLTADELTAASGLKPGEELSNDKIKAAQQAMIDAYKASKKPVNVTITGAIKQTGGTVEVAWTIVETKAKKKPKDTEDQGFKSEADAPN
jgi:outer membrane protein assembly factor BamA